MLLPSELDANFSCLAFWTFFTAFAFLVLFAAFFKDTLLGHPKALFFISGRMYIDDLQANHELSVKSVVSFV